MQSSDRAGHRTLKENYTKICKSNLDPGELGDKLFGKSIIPQGVKSQADLPNQSQDAKRRILIDAVMRQSEPHTFKKFVEIILEDDANAYIGEELKGT